MPIMWKAVVPMEITSLSRENTDSICAGINVKHSVPMNMSAMPNMTDSFNVREQRSILPAA